MTSPLSGISLEQAAAWLTEALQAKHDLLTGKSIVRVNGPSAQIEFNRSTIGDLEKLDAWISTLQSMLTTGSAAAPTVRPIYFGF
jgi:hypothetical protein